MTRPKSSFLLFKSLSAVFIAWTVFGTIFTQFFVLKSYAEGPTPDELKHGCFQRHLREAIELNQTRLPLYSKLSYGESEKTSRQLIRTEKWTLYLAKYFDWKAKKFQDLGIPIMCAEFVPMSTVAPFFQNPDRGPRFPRPVPDLPRDVDTGKLQKNIKTAYRESGFEGISNFLKLVLKNLEEEGPYHCLTRHVLESILRTALLAPVHMEKAKKLGLPSTQSLSWNFIRAQLYILSDVNQTDRNAFPTQTAWGIPMICGDVPRIVTPDQMDPQFRFSEEPNANSAVSSPVQ